MKRLILSLWLVVVVVCCKKNEPLSDVITMRVADHRQDCVGVAPQKCLLVKTDGATNWQFFYDGIHGFTYEEGFEYQLLVKREPITNPPADGSSIRYTLVQVLDKTKV